MPGFKFTTFSGLLPFMSESLLPPSNATAAQNCDFAYQELRNIKGDFFIQTMSNAPASIYTDDGLLFYSWPTDVDAVRSPLSRDTFDRLYFTTPGDFRVTTRTGMTITGGQPGSSYRVGVPAPTVAPTFTVAAAPSIEDTTITAKFHYEYSGVKYQEAAIDLTVVTADKVFSFVPPDLTEADQEQHIAGTPTQAFPVIHLTATDNTTHDVIFDLYTENSSLAKSGSGWALSLARADGAESYTLTLAPATSELEKQTTAYVYTYVNTYNEEGPPSPPIEVTAGVGLPVTVTATRDVQSADYAPIKEIRFYRTPVGSDVADYFYDGSIEVLTESGTTFSFLDNVKASGLNEPLSSASYYPPDQALVGLMQLPNGILAAWKGNELHFSDAYKPWSWPPQYVKTFTHDIVSGVAHGSGALVTTRGQPYLVSGVSPDSMSDIKLKTPQAGVSKWSVADVGGVLVYASNDGIVAVEGGQSTLDYSEHFFTRDVWRQRYKNGFTTMRFAVWDGRLIVFSSTGAFVPFMIRLDEAKGAMTDLPAFAAACSFVSPLSDQCYFTSTNRLYQFAGGSDLAATWQSREIVMPEPINFGAAQFVGSGSWSIQFYSNDETGALVLRHTKAVTAGAIFRLPSGFTSDRWQVKATGTGRFRELYVARTPEEFGNV